MTTDAVADAQIGRLPVALAVEEIRRDFPAMELKVYGKPLAYLDNAATSQKPRSVIDAEAHWYLESCANVHRGVHALSVRATAAYESARQKVASFVNAASAREIVFVKGTTDAVNLVAGSFARGRLDPGDEIVITGLEHHSNIVPWQLVCEDRGAKLRVARLDDRGDVDMEEFARLLSERTKMVAVSHVSNALGTINPVERMIELAHERDIPILIDGAQAVPHKKVDVQALGCDFYAFSSHKMFGPTGVGALYGRHDLLAAMPPYQGGGEMIRTVSFERTEYAEPPARFEAGTPNIAGAVGFGAAVDYLERIGLDRIEAYEDELLAYATAELEAVPGVRLIGTARRKAAVLSFVIGDVHAHDVGTILDQEGVAIRTGHHCAQPVMQHFGVPATSRASLAFYNTREEVDRLVVGLDKIREVFGG